MPPSYDKPGVYSVQHKRGDSTNRIQLTVTTADDGAAFAVTSFRAQIRDNRGTLIYEFTTTGDAPNASIENTNELVLPSVPGATTAAWPVGSHDWDLEVTLPDGSVKTWIEGTWAVTVDVTRSTP